MIVTEKQSIIYAEYMWSILGPYNCEDKREHWPEARLIVMFDGDKGRQWREEPCQ